MKNLFIGFTMLFLIIGITHPVYAQCPSGEINVTIQLSTDNWGYEAYWELIDQSNNSVLQFGGNPNAKPPGQQIADETDPGAYNENASYNFDFCVPYPSDLLLKLYDDYGDGGTEITILVDNILIFSNKEDDYDELLEFEFSIPLPNLDLGLTKISPSGKISKGFENFVKATLQNSGKDTVKSVKLHWTVDSEPTRTQNFFGINIAPGASQELTADLGWKATGIGNKELKVWLTNVNGLQDENPNNDELINSLEVFQKTRNGLVELWTGASCGYCAIYVPPLLEEVMSRPSHTYAIAYETDWVGPDPMYDHNPQHVESRRSYYGNISGVPHMVYNGNYFKEHPVYFTSDTLESAVTIPTIAQFEDLNIELHTDTANNDTLKFSAVLNATGDIPVGHVVHMVVVEEEIWFNNPPGTNGETHFPYVMKYMVPNQFGTSLDPMQNGDMLSLSGKWGLKNVYDKDELAVVFFVQNNSTKEVVQADYINLKAEPDVSIPEEETSISEMESGNTLKFYPNPAQNELYLSYEVKNLDAKQSSIRIYDQMGRLVKEFETGTLSGSNTFRINTANLSNGMYILQLQSGKEMTSEKFIIQK
ncbi:MAG: T9SS type A sorting domain-containing protein [Chitinophagales bacterium]